MRTGHALPVALVCGLGAVALFAWDGTPETAAPPPAPTGDAHADDIRHLTWLVREKWSWLEMRTAQGLDLDALEAEALAAVAREPGDRGFLRALRRYVSGLRDGHANIEFDGVDLREARRWPFSLVEVREGVVVDGIAPVTFKLKALQRGDLVLAVDDVPIDQVIAARERFVSASTPGARRRKAIWDLTESTSKKAIRVRAHRAGAAEPVTVEIPCPPPEAPVPRRAWRWFKRKYEDLDADTAYFCVGSFSPNDPAFQGATPEAREAIVAGQYDEFARTIARASKRTHMVLDLRGNPGGTDLLGQALARHLIAPGFRYYGLVMKRDGAWPEPSWPTPDAGHGQPRFSGRIACLIDEQTFSVADNIAACLRDEHSDIVFVGQPTGGGSGAPRVFTLPSTKARVRFCTMRVCAPNGTWIEGNGVVPDVAVRPTRAEMLAGKDAVLAAAVAALGR
ncbi:MAG: S41 family peptidase [Planctomycetota bacterium]|jgi:C-terminal processing protease CtpA/Prc